MRIENEEIGIKEQEKLLVKMMRVVLRVETLKLFLITWLYIMVFMSIWVLLLLLFIFFHFCV